MIANLESDKHSIQTPASIKIFLPAMLGTVVEYYDYALYGFCAGMLAEQFFPTEDKAVALLKTFAIFFSGSLSKPIGAILFGSIGDKFGRSVALKICMIGIALPTLGIGLMPTYAQMGWWAPLLLLLFRMLQGIFTGGETDGARIYIFESVGKNRPCFANGLFCVAWMAGIYLASLTSSLALTINIPDHAWRIPFLIGALMGILVFCSRFYLFETSAFKAELSNKSVQASGSLIRILLKNKKIILGTILLCGSVGGTYHFYLVFFGNYLSTILNIVTSEQITSSISQAVLVYTLCSPVAGLLADRFGAMTIFKFSLYSLCVVAIINIIMLYRGTMPVWLMLLTAGLLSANQAPGFVILLRKISINERYRTEAFGHAMGSILFSGSAPVISTWIWQLTQAEIAPLYYFIILLFLGFLAAYIIENIADVNE